jgi:NAD(P)-dependent dehydrogenase (short-subunit alcohol dehydrogenase family)
MSVLNESSDVCERVAFITGGGRGLGRAIAARLAREGAKVVVTGPQQGELDETVALIANAGGEVHSILADLRSAEETESSVNDARSTFGSIDILINNSGIAGPAARVDDVTVEQWNDVMAINLSGAFLSCKYVASEMVERRSGKIINISSIAGRIAYPLRSPYAASKWGLIGLTKSLAKELGPFNIQVNAICPGPVEGERMQNVFSDRAAATGQSVDEVRAEYLQASALGRLVPPEDIVETVAFLASRHGNNITGQAIEVTSGYAL